jgi:hypothetical protein
VAHGSRYGVAVVLSLPEGWLWPRALRRQFEREALPITIVALWLSLLTLELPNFLGPDSWFSLVGGRFVAEHGLPHVDSLTYWTLGRTWIDQQWGAQLILYEIAAHAGVRAAIFFGIGCIGTALALAAAATRRLGASARSAAIGISLPLLGAPWLTQLRAQSLALPLFVAVFWLLASDSRRATNRVLLTLPLLAVWANVHGSVALGAALVALYGFTRLRDPRARARAAVLVCAAPLTLLVSPYGFDLVRYYRLMLLHPPFAKYVFEWQPPRVSPVTAIFFASVVFGAALWGAHRHRLTGFERWALILLLLAAFTAIRNAVWFELALAIGLPRLLDGAWPSRIELTGTVRRLNVGLSCAAVLGLLAAVAAQAQRPSPLHQNGYSPAAAAKIANTAGGHGIVLADEMASDWLLWEQPQLAGRVAFDARFELLNAAEVRQVYLLEHLSHAVWGRCGVRARVVVFRGADVLQRARSEAVLAARARVIVRTPTVVAVEQPAVRGFCQL